MTSVIAANWKMNGSKSSIDKWFELFFENVLKFEAEKPLTKDSLLVILSVPAVFLEYSINLAKIYNQKTQFIKIKIAAQDCHYAETGAFTGDISPLFLKELGCEFAIIGHSERRQYHFESDEIVLKKAESVLKNGLTPIVCVGESLEVRESGKYLKVVSEQAKKSTSGLNITKVIVAYEPVWAIGTGKVPSEQDINEMNKHLKEILAKMHSVKEEDVVILYGGSVKSDNSGLINHLKYVNGVLVGGASLKGDEFFKIAINAL